MLFLILRPRTVALCLRCVFRPVRVLGQPRSQAQTSRLWDIADGGRGELGLGDIGGIGRSLVVVLDFHHRWRENTVGDESCPALAASISASSSAMS